MDVIHSRKATWLRLSEFTHISELFLWDLTKRRYDIVVVDMQVHMVADKVVGMVADKKAKTIYFCSWVTWSCIWWLTRR